MSGTICGQCGTQYGNDVDCAIHEERKHGIPNPFKKKLSEPIEHNSTPQSEAEKNATSPDPLAQIAESLKPVSEFFAHFNNGEVYLKADVEHLQDFQVLKGYRVVISPKVGN